MEKEEEEEEKHETHFERFVLFWWEEKRVSEKCLSLESKVELISLSDEK